MPAGAASKLTSLGVWVLDTAPDGNILVAVRAEQELPLPIHSGVELGCGDEEVSAPAAAVGLRSTDSPGRLSPHSRNLTYLCGLPSLLAS